MKTKKAKGKKKIQSVYKVTKVLLNKVRRLAKQGLSIEQIAVSIGWGKTKIFEVKKNDPNFANAIKEGQTKNIQEVVNAMSRIAKGYKTVEAHSEEGTTEKGKFKKTKTINKSVAPNATAGIFILTNRDPENWKHKTVQEHEGGIDLRVGSITKKDAKVVNDLFDGVTEE